MPPLAQCIVRCRISIPRKQSRVAQGERCSGPLAEGGMLCLFEADSPGSLFVHEHPMQATSWNTECIRNVLRQPGVQLVRLDMCQYGLVTKEGAPAMKPTFLMTNSTAVAEMMAARCDGSHQHQQLLDGRARAAQFLPSRIPQSSDSEILSIFWPLERGQRLQNKSSDQVGC